MWWNRWTNALYFRKEGREINSKGRVWKHLFLQTNNSFCTVYLSKPPSTGNTLGKKLTG